MLPSQFYQVRQSVCVAGINGDAIRDVKGRIAGLLKDPVPLESFHVRSPEDVKDGAFLVPKVVLVASHCPGKKVIDDDGDEGQLDRLYDEACDVGGEIRRNTHRKLNRACRPVANTGTSIPVN